MTIEEKAKAYDEALERAKAMIKVAANQDEAIGFANTIFPELKESEDERIRKALIENFKWFCGNYPETSKWGKDDNLLVKDIIAWLEKQGDKDKLIKELGEYKVKYTQEVLSQQLEKQSKKKSQRIISAEAKEALYGKLAWSEEDEDTYNRVYCLFRDANDEWYKAIFSGCYPKITRDKVLTILKSLKSQSHWKPTKEQLKALQMVRDSHCFMYQQDRINIKTLLEQLKSL